ncbi:MAG: gamma-glutamyltransferase family protein [Thermoguttaceae bacterium]
MQTHRISRRDVLKTTGAAALGSLCAARLAGAEPETSDVGWVVGEKTGEAVGMRVLADGASAVDAVVAAALAAAIAAPASTGIGGFGMSAVIAPAGGKPVMAIDGNSAAPAAMRPDTFQPGPDGKLPKGFIAENPLNSTGWMSAGVPGILAGLQLALDRFGTRQFSELVQPAIELARKGFPCPPALCQTLTNNEPLWNDPGSRALYYPGGKPPATGDLVKNPELAEMLAILAKEGSVEAFYRGPIGRQITDAFQQNGGLVTAGDMAAYRARLVEPCTIAWGDQLIHTAPPTAGGVTTLQMLLCLKAMKWQEMEAGPMRTHACVEAMRLAWRDRLTLLGDPAFAPDPVVPRLLSEDHARQSAEKVLAAVKAGTILAHDVEPRRHTGTINLCAADRQGNFVALTLSHGNGFGARVTVPGLGLTLGHGMSRFDPRPDHPNAPGPGKRPLHNMVPTIVTRGGRTVLAVGGTGGRKIPSSLLGVLTQFAVLRRPLEDAIAAPRLHTEGDLALTVEKGWPAAEIDGLGRLGYQVQVGKTANMSAVALEDGVLRKARR